MNEDQINGLSGTDKATESNEEMLGEENQVQQETPPQIVQQPTEPTTRDLSMFLGMCDNLEEQMSLVEPNYDAREMMMCLLNKIRGHYQENYNKKVNDNKQDLITRYLSRKQEENRQVIEAIERVEVEDEGEEDRLNLASLPEDFYFEGFDLVVVAEAVVEEGGGATDIILPSPASDTSLVYIKLLNFNFKVGFLCLC
ncbi:hypothetical protein Hamer_G001091 [Homarus americanus]|uniref:Uncharacterized protein n=1 Tax=Homarus americanus TaxID=6706 RepID=A0A8J5T2F5_HOMAM|nr:hypothetical protein Hamer_G001091 [Homarus americanus]